MVAAAPSYENVAEFASLPPVYVLKAQITSQTLREAEESLLTHGASLTYDAREAGIVLTDVATARRARLELKWLGVELSDVESKARRSKAATSRNKRLKLESETSASPDREVDLESNDISSQQSGCRLLCDSNDHDHSRTREEVSACVRACLS